MVSLWPWKGEDNSPASFEKVLSALAAKISKSHSQLDSLRQRSRRFKALWTLYTTISYIISVIILLLVVGWKNWSALEYTAVAGSPLLIYLIRSGITTYYNLRIDTVTQRLESQQAERAKTIDKLKTATKYNSTQELLEKYGGVPAKPKKQAASTPAKGLKNVQKQPQRTSIGPPPPTANIGRPNHISSQPSTPQLESRSPSSYVVSSQVSAPRPGPQTQAEFAPNAFSVPPQYADGGGGGEISFAGHWYDRILDLLLGEDETSPKNRVALICQSCRLVNGQAPPGTKSLAELGKWKCFGCGVMNGEEDEAVKAVQEMKERILTQEQPVSDEVEGKVPDKGVGADSQNNDDDGDEHVDGMEENSERETVEVEPKQGTPKGSRKEG